MADDTMSRLSELLSDEESLQQIAELAQMFRSGDEEVEQGNGGMLDISAIAGLAGVAASLQQSDPNADLLAALRPHLGEERQRRLDKAVKLLRIASVIGAAKENGLI